MKTWYSSFDNFTCLIFETFCLKMYRLRYFNTENDTKRLVIIQNLYEL